MQSCLAQTFDDQRDQIVVQIATFEVTNNAITIRRINFEDASHRFGGYLFATKLG